MKLVEKKAAKAFYSCSLYFASGALARQVEKLAIEIWKPSGLHPSHAHLLLLILSDAIWYPTILAKELSVSPSTITRLLDKLEEKELIKRMPYEQLAVVYSTNKARVLEPLLVQCQRKFDAICNGMLGQEETYRLTRALTGATDLLAQETAKAHQAGSNKSTARPETPDGAVGVVKPEEASGLALP